MKDWRYKIRMFLTALFISFAGIIPAVRCPGGCGPCFNCAGLGGALAVLAAIGTARKIEHDAVATDRRSQSGGSIGKTVSGAAERPATK